MKLRKSLALSLAAITVMSSLLAGCGSSAPAEAPAAEAPAAETEAPAEEPETEAPAAEEAASGEPVTVTIWFNSDAMDTKQAAVDMFNEQHDNITVEMSFYDTDGLKDQLKIAASSGTLPDSWKTYGGSFGGYFVDNDLALDLTSYAEEHGWYEKFNNGTLDLLTYNGSLYGYPCSYNVVNMYYRKDIFAQYNLEVPTTFEEFEEVCKVLKENGVTPISTAALYGWHTMRLVELFVEHYAGAELHDKLNNFEVSWDCPEVIEALAKYKEFCDNGYFPDGFVTANPDDTRYNVYTGDCAMDIDGQWFDSYIIDDEMNMDDYGYFVLPTGGTNRVSAFAEMFQFNKDITPEKLAAVMEFYDFFISDEAVELWPTGYNLPLPINGSKAPADQVHIDPIFEESAANGTFTITDQAFPSEIADALFNVQTALANNEITPEEGAKTIQDAVDTYFAQ